jgi:hypothetical protein
MTSAAVEVGFEPTEGLPLNTLSRTAHHRSPPSASVLTSADRWLAAAGERWRTGVNETKTEPRSWCRGPPPTGPRTCRQRPNDCRCESVPAETGPALVGTHQDLLGGYEAGSLLIADSERMADRGPSLIAPNADLVRVTPSAPRIVGGVQIYQFGVSSVPPGSRRRSSGAGLTRTDQRARRVASRQSGQMDQPVMAPARARWVLFMRAAWPPGGSWPLGGGL